MHLALDDHGIDDGAEVVHCRELVHAGYAGSGVHFHLTDVGTCGEGEVGRVVERCLVQAGLQLVQRVVVRHVGSERNLAESHFFIGALDGELAVGELDVGIAGLHQVGRDFLGLGLDLVQRLHDGCTTDRDRARAVGSHAEGHAAGVAMDHVHRVNGYAQTGRYYLRKRGFMSLAVAV